MSRADKNEAITKADMAVFQQERQDLETDLLSEVLNSRRTAWWAATGLGGLAAVAFAVAGLTMYRYSQPVPAHMLVLNPDGSIQQVSLLTPQSTYGEVSDTYWVSGFIRHYETYEFNTVQADYDAVGLMSGPDVAEQYQNRYKWGTKEAMDKVVGDRKSVRVKISSVILDREKGIATVRFSTRGCKPETQKFPSADQHGLSRAWSMSSCIARMTSSWVYDLALGSSASRRASSTSRVIRTYSSGHSACSMRSDACPSRCSRPNSRMSLVATTCSRIRSWITSQARCASGVAVPS
uniref:Bacterial virulence protein VirB8 domain-containing protein n=1 Tax=Ectopseudomonas mendocina TaxID=300 RepID=A0A514C8C6_ECTME|nr:hypothetical protein [Pseudomonas mendocina]